MRRIGLLAALALLMGCSACSSKTPQTTTPSASSSPTLTIALPTCDRTKDQPHVGKVGCLYETALSYGYEDVAANSFALAYGICYDTDFNSLVADYGSGSRDQTVIARTFSNRLFNNDESERAGFDGCLLAFGDRHLG
jgi:hypothetical protein